MNVSTKRVLTAGTALLMLTLPAGSLAEEMAAEAVETGAYSVEATAETPALTPDPLPEATAAMPEVLPPEDEPTPLAPEATAVLQPTPAAVTAAPERTRAPYVEVYVHIEGLEKALTAGEPAELRFSADYFEDRKKLASSAAKGRTTEYDQALAQEYVSALWVTFDSDFLDVFATADGKTPVVRIVEGVSADNYELFGLKQAKTNAGNTAYVDRDGNVYEVKTPFNAGWRALENTRVREDIASGTYTVKARLHWIPLGEEREASVPFDFQVTVNAAQTVSPSPAPSETPSAEPTEEPQETEAPTETPVESEPTATPDAEATEHPMVDPLDFPTEAPTESPTAAPTEQPAQTGAVTLRPEKIYTTQGEVLPGSSINVQFGVEYLVDGRLRYRTNASGQPATKYSQAITQEVSALWAELDADRYWEIFSTDAAEAPSSEIVLRLTPANAAAAGLSQDRQDGNLFWDGYNNAYHTGDAINNGFASFYGLTLRGDLQPGEYTQTGTLHCQLKDATEVTSDFSFVLTVGAIEPEPTESYGGGGYGGGGGGESVSTPDPAAKLIIEKMQIKPEQPKPGDTFDIVLSLRNTSEKQPIRNVDLTFATENNVIRPTSGLNRVHLADIPAGKTEEVTLNVRAGVEIADDLVHMNVTLDYEDKDAAAKQATQEVFLSMARVQRMELDEPVLPNEAPIAQEGFSVKINVTNKGRNVLDNVSARVVSDDENLMSTGSWYGGNMEAGAQKTAEIELIPAVGGDYQARLEVSYEDSLTGQLVTETRDLFFMAAEAETYDDYYYDEGEDYGDYSEEETSEEAAPTLKDRISNLPPWLYAVLGGGVVLLLTALSALARRIRRKGLDDDEMD